MAGPSPYNRRLKARNDRRKARASRGGRTPSEAALGRSMRAGGNRVSRTNTRATAPPSTRTFSSPRSPKAKRAKRTGGLAKPAELPGFLGDAQEAAQDFLEDRERNVRTAVQTVLRELEKDQRRNKRVMNDPEATPLAKGLAFIGSAENPIGPGKVTTSAARIGKGGIAVRRLLGGEKIRKAGKAVKNPSAATKNAANKGRQKAANTKRKARRVKERSKTSEGRKGLAADAARGTARGAGRAAQGVGKRAATSKLGVAAGTVVLADEQGIADSPILDQAATDVRGSVKAFSPDNIGRTLDTTKRAIPGILTGVARPVVAGAKTTGRAVETNLAQAGVPGMEKFTSEEVFSPVVETTKQSVKETGKMLEPFVSGSEEEVTKAVRDEIGAAALVLTPKALSITRKASKPATSALRRANKKRLDKKDAEKEAKGEARTPRVKDSVDGGEYVIRPLGNALENRRRRVEWSRQTSRGKAQALALTTQELRPIQRAIRGVKAPKGRKVKEYRKAAADALSTVLAYGIPRNYDAAMARIAKAEAKIDNPNRTTIDRTAVTDRDNFEFLKNNPEIFDDPAFWEGVDLLRTAQDKVTTSEVKRYLTIGVDYGLKTPEERLEEGVVIGDRTIKAKDMDPDLYERKTQQVRQFRREQRLARKKGDEEAFLEAKGKADKLAQQLRDYNIAAKKARSDFVEEAKAIAAREGLETPAYVKSEQGSRAALEASPANPAFNRMAFRTFKDKDDRRQAGTADRSFDALVRSSVYAPRAKRIIHNLVTNFAVREAVPVQTARGTRRYLTSAEIRQAILDGQIDPKQMAVFHSQHFRRAVQDRNAGEVGSFIELTTRPDSNRPREVSLDALDAFDAEIKGSLLTKGHKYIVVRRDAAKEMETQFGQKDNFALKANRIGSRVLLGYNPAWAAAQLLAEGLPAAVAIGANPARWARILNSRRKDYEDLTPEERAAVDALAGQSAGVTPVPVPGFESKGSSLPVSSRSTMDRVKNPRSVLAENSNPLTRGERSAEFLRSVARGDALGKFDRMKGGGIRKLVVAAQVDREFNSFMKGLGGVLRLDDELTRKMGPMTLAQKQAAIARNPELARRMESYLDDVMGNWRAISRLEKGPASLTAFYPFVRYSIKTAFWGFPKRHPIKASILYFFAQMNANELESFMDGEPLDWLNYAYPVIRADGKAQVAPSATRFTPALSAVVEAVGTNNIRRVLSGVNPIIGVGLQTASGQDTFTGEQVAESAEEYALLGLAALTSMVGPIRIADSFLNQEGDKRYLPSGFRPRRTWEEGDPTTIGGRSKTSMKLRKLDPDRDWRTAINVLGTMPIENLRKQRRMINAIERGETGSLSGSGGSSSSRRENTTNWLTAP